MRRHKHKSDYETIRITEASDGSYRLEMDCMGARPNSRYARCYATFQQTVLPSGSGTWDEDE